MTTIEISSAYVEIAVRDRDAVLAKIKELSVQVEKIDQHIAECRAAIVAEAKQPEVTCAD